MSNSPCLPQTESQSKTPQGKSGLKLSKRPKMMNIMRMKDILQESKMLENLVVDAFAGIFSVANAFLLLPNHITFIGCEVDLSCLTEKIAQLILIYG